MTMITDLSLDLVKEILSKVPLTSLKAVKSTCKEWNTLSKDESFTKKHSAKEFPLFLTFDYRCLQIRFNLRIIRYNIKEYPEPCIKEIGKLDSPIDLHIVNHCDGLLLCYAEVNRLVVWNPYLGQTRWIELSNKRSLSDLYAIGYGNNKNHKVLVLLHDAYDDNKLKHEIYDFKSSSWRAVDINNPPRRLERGVSLKGNSYFVVDGKLIGFDFTREKFGPCMDLPFDDTNAYKKIPYSCVSGEQLAVLCQRKYEFLIWIITEVKPDAVSWSNFLKVDMEYYLSPDHGFTFGSFFLIDKEKKVAVVCGVFVNYRKCSYYDDCLVVGEHGWYQEDTHMEDVLSYVPSLVQIQ